MSAKKSANNLPILNQEHYIVAIGASAGGLEAIHDFFDNAKETSNISYVIIQHLSPDYKSLLVELVAKHTQMNVFEAENNIKVEKNCIYVIPPKKIMTISNGHLLLTDKKASDKGPNTAIDNFLYSLAEEQNEKAIAVILSGTGTDGTRGIEAIKEAGGIIMVQDPDTAKFDGMPKSAIGSGIADFILPPSLMPAELNNIIHDTSSSIFPDGKIDESLLATIFKLLLRHTGCDFQSYKLPTLLRRIARRMRQTGCKSLRNYIAYMQQHVEECHLLCKDFLISVTKFFRDKEAFDSIKNAVLPAIISSKAADDVLKVWICACSTGEEAYSIAILINEQLKLVKKDIVLKMFATDIDADTVEIASKGEYNLSVARDIPSDLLEKYFIKQGQKYIVIPELRKQVVFAKHNVLKDPPFIKNDLVSCRNMLIYMNQSLQQKVLSTFHFALNPGGFLFLGSSETISGMKEHLDEVDRKWKIYLRNTKSKTSFPSAIEKPYGYVSNKFSADQKNIKAPSLLDNLTEDLKAIVADDFGYAALYIDRNYEVKEATGAFRKFLSLPEHSLHLNLLRMVSPELSASLGGAVRKAWKENKKIVIKGKSVKRDNGIHMIDIIVRPGANQDSLTVLVLHEYQDKIIQAPDNDLEPVVYDEKDQKLIAELKHDLSETKLNLQAAIEELETTNEELQSSNEELLSSNEELQSSNEELQSLNEELHTLNTEHQLKINELIELNDDLNNYFKSADIGQLFLDHDLRIRKFNPAAVRLINLIETDIGRPFHHISNNIQNENLIADIQKVIHNNVIVEKELTLQNGKIVLMRLFPYIKQDKKIDGVVLTFVDISITKELSNIITGVYNASQNAIMVFKTVRDDQKRIIDFKWIAANKAAEEIYNKKVEELIGASLKTVCPAVVPKGLFNKYVSVVNNNEHLHIVYPYKCSDREGWWEIDAVKIQDGLAATFTDVTEKKMAAERLQKSYDELMAAKDELKKLNDELENMVTERTRKLAISEERFRLVSKATNDAIIDWDLTNNTIWLSDSFYNMFGYTMPAGIIERNYWLEKIHPLDRKRMEDSIKKAIGNRSRQWTDEYRYLKEDQTIAFILDRGYILLDEHGMPYRMLHSMIDVTTVKEARQEAINSLEQKEFLAESMPLIVWTAAPNGRVTSFNRQFSSFTGLSIEDGIDQGWEAIVDPDHLPLLKDIWKQAINDKADFAFELKLKKYDGSYCWHLLRAKAKKNEKDKIVMWVGSATDIHEQKMASEIMEQQVAMRTLELQKANAELEISNNDLQQFASVASHDLKEPLRKIHMFSNMLKDRFLKDNTAANEYMDRIISSSSRMTKLINDLLSFSRLSMNSLFEHISLNTIIDDILADLELSIHEKKAEIHVDRFPIIEAVPGQMRQVFQNIISNALKFTRKGVPPKIVITCRRIPGRSFGAPTDENGSFIEVAIKDNGIGFDQKYTDRIFTIFQRLHTRQEYEGTGIGLAICKKIVDKHNGIITADGMENQGAAFTIILPVAQQNVIEAGS